MKHIGMTKNPRSCLIPEIPGFFAGAQNDRLTPRYVLMADC